MTRPNTKLVTWFTRMVRIILSSGGCVLHLVASWVSTLDIVTLTFASSSETAEGPKVCVYTSSYEPLVTEVVVCNIYMYIAFRNDVIMLRNVVIPPSRKAASKAYLLSPRAICFALTKKIGRVNSKKEIIDRSKSLLHFLLDNHRDMGIDYHTQLQCHDCLEKLARQQQEPPALVEDDDVRTATTSSKPLLSTTTTTTTTTTNLDLTHNPPTTIVS